MRTIALGSRKRGESALHTSWTAPSSDQVAARMVSRYWGILNVCGAYVDRLCTYFRFGRGCFRLAGELDHFVVTGHRKFVSREERGMKAWLSPLAVLVADQLPQLLYSIQKSQLISLHIDWLQNTYQVRFTISKMLVLIRMKKRS